MEKRLSEVERALAESRSAALVYAKEATRLEAALREFRDAGKQAQALLQSMNCELVPLDVVIGKSAEAPASAPNMAKDMGAYHREQVDKDFLDALKAGPAPGASEGMEPEWKQAVRSVLPDAKHDNPKAPAPSGDALHQLEQEVIAAARDCYEEDDFITDKNEPGMFEAATKRDQRLGAALKSYDVEKERVRRSK